MSHRLSHRHLRGDTRVSDTSMSVEGLLDFAHKFLVSCRSSLHVYDNVCKEHDLSSALRFHVGTLCASILGALCALFWYGYVLPYLYRYALAGFEVFHKGSPKLQGSNLVFLWPRWNNFLEIEGQYHFRPLSLMNFLNFQKAH